MINYINMYAFLFIDNFPKLLSFSFLKSSNIHTVKNSIITTYVPLYLSGSPQEQD